MRGKYRIRVQNRMLRYDFEIKRNITIIKGDSATGKTTLVDMIREYYENGADSGVELICDVTCGVLEGRGGMQFRGRQIKNPFLSAERERREGSDRWRRSSDWQ